MKIYYGSKQDSIQQGKDFLKESWRKGAKCPCCGQLVKLYQRKITSAMAYGLILLHNLQTDDFIHIENWLKEKNIPSSIRGDFPKLKHWELIKGSRS